MSTLSFLLLDAMSLFNNNQFIEPAMKLLLQEIPSINVTEFVAHKHFKNIFNSYLTQNGLPVADCAFRLVTALF
jgi:hypothetical protein